MRDFYRQARFITNKFFFGHKERFRIFWSDASIARELVRIIFPSLSSAIIPILLLEAVERLLLRTHTYSVIPYFGRLIESLDILRDKAIADASTVNALLSILASASGIFLGLYFTAISVVASAGYTHTPSALRELLLKEKVGNYYIRALTVLMASSLLLLGMGAFGYRAGALSLLYVIALGCFGVFCFGALGVRAFYFFDPTKLSDSIFLEMTRNIRSATIDGFRWDIPDFQAHYYKLASQSVSELNALVNTCLREKHLKQTALMSVLRKSTVIMMTYSQQRIRIPTNSQWYGRAPRHKSWFLHDHSHLDIALRTNTPIPPEVVPTPEWLEERIANIQAVAISRLLDTHELEAVHRTLSPANNLLQTLGALLEVKRAANFADNVGSPIDRYFRGVNKETQLADETALALFDMRGFNLLSLAMGYFQFLREFNIEKVDQRIRKVDWASKSDIYKAGFSPALLERLEFLRVRLHYELNVEGCLVSPQWYISQLLLMKYLELLHTGLENIFLLIDTHFINECDTLLRADLHVYVVNRAYRGLEICWKFERHVSTLKGVVDALNQRLINAEVKKPNWDFSGIETRIRKIRDVLIQKLSSCLLPLASISHKDTLPDLFGQTYTTICQYCYDCMIDNRPHEFSVAFPPVFMSALHAHDRLRTMLCDWRPEAALGISADPLLDIMELSGYAMIFSEVYATTEFQAICEDCWGSFIRKKSEPKTLLSTLVGFYELRRSQFQMYPRDILRTNWQIQMNRKLLELGLIDEPYGMPYGGRRPVVGHTSSLIRALCMGRMEPHTSAAEVFIVAHLLKRPEGVDIMFNSRWGFAERLNKEMASEPDEGGDE